MLFAGEVDLEEEAGLGETGAKRQVEEQAGETRAARPPEQKITEPDQVLMFTWHR